MTYYQKKAGEGWDYNNRELIMEFITNPTAEIKVANEGKFSERIETAVISGDIEQLIALLQQLDDALVFGPRKNENNIMTSQSQDIEKFLADLTSSQGQSGHLHLYLSDGGTSRLNINVTAGIVTVWLRVNSSPTVEALWEKIQ